MDFQGTLENLSNLRRGVRSLGFWASGSEDRVLPEPATGVQSHSRVGRETNIWVPRTKAQGYWESAGVPAPECCWCGETDPMKVVSGAMEAHEHLWVDTSGEVAWVTDLGIWTTGAIFYETHLLLWQTWRLLHSQIRENHLCSSLPLDSHLLSASTIC